MQVELVGGRLDGAETERRSLPPWAWVDDRLRFWRKRPRRLTSAPYRLLRVGEVARYFYAPDWRECGSCGAVISPSAIDGPARTCQLCGSALGDAHAVTG